MIVLPASMPCYWPERFHYLDEKYRTLPFPFDEIEGQNFTMQAKWDLNAMVGFMASWSATRRYLEREGNHPVDLFIDELRECWGEETHQRTVRWPLYLRIGKTLV